MFIIVDNKPYAVRGNKVYEVGFGEKGKVEISDKPVDIKIKGDFYNYDEIVRKFNVKYLVQKKAQEEALKSQLDGYTEELLKQVEDLTKENEELKARIEELENPSANDEPADEGNEEPEKPADDKVDEDKSDDANDTQDDLENANADEGNEEPEKPADEPIIKNDKKN